MERICVVRVMLERPVVSVSGQKRVTRNPSQSQVGLAYDFVLKELVAEALSNDLS